MFNVERCGHFCVVFADGKIIANIRDDTTCINSDGKGFYIYGCDNVIIENTYCVNYHYIDYIIDIDDGFMKPLNLRLTQLMNV